MNDLEELKRDEMRATACEVLRDNLWDEFEAIYDYAELMEMFSKSGEKYYDDWLEGEFDLFYSERLDNW